MFDKGQKQSSTLSCDSSYFKKRKREMNINIRNEFNFSDVHATMNGSGSLAKLT